MKSSDIDLKESDDGYAIFFLKECPDWEFYDIKLSDLATSRGWDEWTSHLENKNWYDFTIESKLSALVRKWMATNGR